MKKLAVLMCAAMALFSVPEASAQILNGSDTAFGFFRSLGRALFQSAPQGGGGSQFEFEPSIGFGVPFHGGEGFRGMAGVSAGMELRYNVPDKAVDAGIELNYTATARHGSDTRGLFNAVPFFGLGLGISDREYSHPEPSYMPLDRPEMSGVAIARIGVELFRHVRLTLDGRISNRDYSALCFRLGYAFGGGNSR